METNQPTLYGVLEELSLENPLTPSIEELPVHHILTTWSSYFMDCRNQIKNFDIRRRKEGRVFNKGQLLFFREFDRPTQTYTGRWDLYYVKYIIYSEETEAPMSPGGLGIKGGSGVDTMGLIHVTGN